MIRTLSEQEARYAMENGEFSASLINKVQHLAIILTQSWCPQWRFLQAYLEGLEPQLEAQHSGKTAILSMEYDKTAIFHPFMHFKETVFKNDQVPYIRYYKNGKLITESNFISAQGFRDRLLGLK